MPFFGRRGQPRRPSMLGNAAYVHRSSSITDRFHLATPSMSTTSTPAATVIEPSMLHVAQDSANNYERHPAPSPTSAPREVSGEGFPDGIDVLPSDREFVTHDPLSLAAVIAYLDSDDYATDDLEHESGNVQRSW